MLTGGCHCGGVRYEAEGDPLHHAICHCADCRHTAGAPMVGWIAFPSDRVRVTSGAPKTRASSESAQRSFCPECGTGLFYTNEAVLPGLTDIQSATVDDAGAYAVPAPAHIQHAERLGWTERLEDLPKFERYPG